MTSDSIVDSFILSNTMNDKRYLTMLHDELWSLTSTLKNIEDLIFTQDSTSPHFACAVREWLNAHFLGRWVGRWCSHEWLANISDLTASSVFLWDWLMMNIYFTKATTLEWFEGWTQEVMSSIPQGFLVKSLHRISGRLEKLVANAVAYIKL